MFDKCHCHTQLFQHVVADVCRVDFEFFGTGVNCAFMPGLQSMTPLFHANASATSCCVWGSNGEPGADDSCHNVDKLACHQRGCLRTAPLITLTFP